MSQKKELTTSLEQMKLGEQIEHYLGSNSINTQRNTITNTAKRMGWKFRTFEEDGKLLIQRRK